MAELTYFDCNAMVSQRHIPGFDQRGDIKHLLSVYEYFGIDEGLIYNCSAKHYLPWQGNAELIELLKNYPQLYPAWVVAPHHTGEMPRSKELIRKLKKNNVKAVRILIGRNYYSENLDFFLYDNLLSVLEEHRIPTMVEYSVDPAMGGFLPPLAWRDLHQVLTAFPKLPLIFVCLKSSGMNRHIYALMGKHKNFALEISGYQTLGGYEDITERFGAERLLFGSNMPFFEPGPFIAELQYAHIDDKDKQAIAAGNLKKLISGVRW